jgi:hypothetical protein
MAWKFRTQKILANYNENAKMENHVESMEEVGGHKYPLGSLVPP